MDQSFPWNQAEDGMTRALNHAEADVPSWGEKANAFLRTYAEKKEYFTGYMVVMASELDASFPAPPTSKAWGQIFRMAAKRGVIENSGRTMPHPKRHGCPAAIWRSLVFA